MLKPSLNQDFSMFQDSFIVKQITHRCRSSSSQVNMWAAGVSYDVAGKGFDPTVGKITKCDGGLGFRWCFQIFQHRSHRFQKVNVWDTRPGND